MAKEKYAILQSRNAVARNTGGGAEILHAWRLYFRTLLPYTGAGFGMESTSKSVAF